MALKRKKIIQIFSNGVLDFSNNRSLTTLTKYKYYENNFTDLQSYDIPQTSNNISLQTQDISTVQKYRKVFFN